jgi:hypothetical protein
MCQLSFSRRALSRRLIFLLRPTHHDPKRIIRQRPLQRLGLIPRRAHPNVVLLISRQDHGHRLRMDRLDHSVGGRGQEAVYLMRPRYRLRLGATVPVERCPDTGESEQRPGLIQRKPYHVFLLGLGVRLWCVFGEAIGRDKAAVLRLQPATPVRRGCWRMLVTGGPPVRGGGGMPQRMAG